MSRSHLKQTELEQHSPSIISELLLEHKKLLNSFDLTRFFEHSQAKQTNKSQSLLSLSPSYERINYGPPIYLIIDPPSSGNI